MKKCAQRMLCFSREGVFFYGTISQKLAIAVVSIAFIAIMNVVVVRGILHDFNNVAETLNVAGKLRMLSQKIAFETSHALTGHLSAQTAAIAAMHDYEMALQALIHGGSVFGYEVNGLALRYPAELESIRIHWIDYRRDALATLDAPRDDSSHSGRIEQISSGAANLLNDAEWLVRSITAESKQGQERALQAIYFLLWANVLVLGAVFLLARKRIVAPLRMLIRRSRQLADVEPPFPPNSYRWTDEIGQLTKTLDYSEQRIGVLIAHLEQERQNLAQAEMMFRGLAENSIVGAYIVQNGRFRFVNSKMADMFGYDAGTMTAAVNVFDLVPEADRQVVETNMRRRLLGEIRGVHYERQARRKDGSIFEVEVFGSAMQLDGEPATIGVMLDITERKKAEATAQFATTVYENSSEAMTITDPDGMVIDVNPAFTRITGYRRDEIIGCNINILRSGWHDSAFYRAMWHAINSNGHWQGEIWNRRKNGDVYAEWLTINSSYRNDGTVHQRIALFSDITQKKRADDLIWERANFDSLTGLPNRLMFRDRLEQEMRKSQRAGVAMAMMFVDLDRFKEVNDTLGHAVGDTLLRQAAQRLANCVRETDTVARFGGDEFTIILGELHAPENAERVAQHILAKLAEPFLLGEEIVYVTASVGITFYPEDGTEFDDLLKNADQAMYAAKDLGRNRFQYFTPSMQETAQARRRLAADLRNALAENQLKVFYQPIVDMTDGVIRKAEALIRWQHPKHGLIGPAEFIPIAEETELIVDIGDWIFQQAAQQVRRWRAVYDQSFQISVNTSPVQYRNNGTRYEDWFRFLQSHALHGQGIVVEITEGLLLDISHAITDQLLKFRDAGIQVALDDFGTGYSSLSYLKKLDIDYLKIDRSFACNLVAGSDDMALYEAIIAMAHKIGLKVVAEGVETEVQRDLLTAAGCDFGQGYLFSKPVPADQFDALLNICYRTIPGTMLGAAA